MKKITNKKLINSLSRYGALTAAIAGVADVNGQVMYTNIADVTLDGTNTGYVLDLNNDGTQDYLLRVNTASGTPFAFMFPVTGSYYNSNGIVGFSSFGYNYPSNLSSGATVNGLSPFMPTSERGDLNFNSCAYSGSQFCDGMEGFLGFSFDISGSTHYGWVRVQVAADATTMVIKDYAYDATPGAAITTDATLSTPTKAFENIKVVALNKSIGLYNLPEASNYTLFNVAGQKVLDGKINSSTHVIEASNVSSGVYIIEIIDLNTKATLRKKVVL